MARKATPQTCKDCGTPNLRWTRFAPSKTPVKVDFDSGARHFCDPEQKKQYTQEKTKKKEVYTSCKEFYPQPESEKTPVRKGGVEPNLTETIVRAIQPYLKGQLDEDRVLDLIKKEIAEQPVTKRELIIPDLPPVDTTQEHYCFEDLAAYVALGFPVWLSGPAGSGKTTSAEHLATKTGQKFSLISVNDQTSEFDLLGFENATGKYMRTEFRERFEHGGIFLLDEVDKGSPNVLSVLNVAAENGYCAFPDGLIKRHADFRLIAAGNTWGTGADALYIGSNPLDAAFLSRFLKIEWGYDETLERQLSGNDTWVSDVQHWRKRAIDLEMRIVISPRASIRGAIMLKAGIDRDKVEHALVFAGLSETDISNLKANR